MATINYTGLTTFNKDAAASGKLCVCVKVGYSSTSILSTDDTNFVGAGICTYKDYKFNMTVNGVQYIFNDSGVAANSAAASAFSGVGCMLMMGTIQKSMVNRGNVVVTNIGGNKPTRSGDSYTPASETYNSSVPTNISIDSLNARDHFAVQALQMLLARLDKDPSTLGEDEMCQLSDTAYKWAASMMIAAANARAETDNETPATETPVEVQSLDNNTEKLLNNIEAVLGRSDYATSTTPVQYFKQIIMGNAGIGGANTRPIYVSLKGYDTVAQAEADGWTYSTVDEWWEKDGFEPIEAAYTNTGAKTLPTNKISIAELPALIAAIDRLTAAVQNQ